MSQKKLSKSKPATASQANKRELTLEKVIGRLLLVLGLIGFFASAVLTIEKIALLKDPGYIPSCNISPLLSCGSVMSTSQAEAFGFPNPLIGVAGFAIVTTVGAAILAGGKFKRWFWLGLQTGALFGLLFIHWLFFQSVYNIGALCPYCMVVWLVTIPIFWYTLLYNLQAGHIKLGGRWQAVTQFMQRHHGDILLVWYLAIAGLILNHFWYYWETLI